MCYNRYHLGKNMSYYKNNQMGGIFHGIIQYYNYKRIQAY